MNIKSKTNKVLLLLLIIFVVLNLTLLFSKVLRENSENPKNVTLQGTYVDEATSLILLIKAGEGESFNKFTIESYGPSGLKVKDSGSSHRLMEAIGRLQGKYGDYYVICEDSVTIGILDIVRRTHTRPLIKFQIRPYMARYLRAYHLYRYMLGSWSVFYHDRQPLCTKYYL